MGCLKKTTRTISKAGVFRLARAYATKNKVRVVFYRCSDWNFAEERNFDYKQYVGLNIIDENGNIQPYNEPHPEE